LSATSVGIRSVTVIAETDNTGVVVVGASTVVAALATRRGYPLAAGDAVTFSQGEDGVSDLKSVFIDAMVNGDGVTFVYGGY
jgi:hypothetical protein